MLKVANLDGIELQLLCLVRFITADLLTGLKRGQETGYRSKRLTDLKCKIFLSYFLQMGDSEPAEGFGV